jgi:hypothetical protein
MTVKISLEFPDITAAARFLLAADAIQAAVANSAAPANIPAAPLAPAENLAASPAPAPEKPVAKPKKARAKQNAEPAAPADAVECTLDDVRAALNNLMATQGMQACQDILARYGVTRVSQLLPNRFSDFVAECK